MLPALSAEPASGKSRLTLLHLLISLSCFQQLSGRLIRATHAPRVWLFKKLQAPPWGAACPYEKRAAELKQPATALRRYRAFRGFPDFQQLYDAASIEVAMVRGSMSGPPEEFSQSYLVLLFDTL